MGERQIISAPGFRSPECPVEARMKQQESISAYSSFVYLMELVDQGWQIEPPIYVRPRLRSRLRPEQENTYHFVLKYGTRFSLISVFECPEVRQLLESEQLTIDRL
jgi:hypothetical protein